MRRPRRHPPPECPEATVSREVIAVGEADREHRADLVVAEEPLQIRVLAERRGRRRRHSVAITMRTPGDDLELAAGFLFTEGVVSERAAVARLAHCDDPAAGEGNIVDVALAPGVDFDPERFRRNVYVASSCGVCGKASLELLRAACPAPPAGDFRLRPSALSALPGRLAETQPVFARTGGLHAAALFEPGGELLLVREDVGRHNAVDKLVGALLLADELPATGTLLLVSGRASFELVQKAAMAGIPLLAAVGAPSSLAVATAAELGMTLVGFLRGGRFNVYAGAERIEI